MRPPIERLSPSDALELRTDVGPVPMNVGALLTLKTRAGFDVDVITSLLAERASLVPRLRQRLVPVPWWCGRPVWVDDGTFDIHQHVRQRVCPPPGDERTLLDLAAALLAEPLSMEHPLWSATVVTGLQEGQTAVLVAFHHVLSDGLGGLALLAGLVDGGRLPSPKEEIPYGFPPLPSRADLVRDAARSGLRGLGRVPRAVRAAGSAVTKLGMGRPERLVPSSLNRPTGRRRFYTTLRTDLAAVHDVAHAHGVTVNDLLLTVITGALQQVVRSRGEEPDRLVVSVPVSHRTAGATDLGNHVGVMPVSVPMVNDPWAGLREVGRTTRGRKTVARVSEALLGPVFRLLALVGVFRWFVDHQRLVNTFFTNMRGPDQPVRLADACVTSIVPLTGTTGNVTSAFAALSYAGQLTLSVVTDPDLFPDMPMLIDGLRDQLTLLGVFPGAPFHQQEKLSTA
jgi:WS/DGAT/MGAT family acyltransferase